MKIFALVLFIVTSHSYADENFVLSGAGTISCGKFLESQQKMILKQMQLSWAQGFLSGMNVADYDNGKKMISLPDAETINLYLLNFCSKYPLDSPARGTAVLYKELRNRDMKTVS